MERKYRGKYHCTSFGNEVVRAFVPHPLPPRPALDMSVRRLRALQECAAVALGRLDSVSSLLPDPLLFLYFYVRREAVLSSQIEGTQSSLSDLLLYELDGTKAAQGFSDVAEVSNYVAALNYGIARLSEGFPLCNRLLREVHELLLSGTRGSHKNPGEFRQSQNWIGGSRPGNAHFVPPPPEHVVGCMSDLELFLNDDSLPYSVLVKAAMAHVQFETIHPFLDGNGRVGRLLISMILHHNGILSQPLLYLSLYLKRNRDEYYRLLNTVRATGDWEQWVEFFLRGVESTANNAVKAALLVNQLIITDKERLSSAKLRSATNAFDAFIKRPILSATDVAKHCGISFPTAQKAVQQLLDARIIDVAVPARRGKRYVYTQYMQLLSEGTEL